MTHKSLWFKLNEPTEEQLFAEIDEFFSSLEHALINPTSEDYAAAAKIFFAPPVRKALKRTVLETQTLRARNQQARQRAAVKYTAIQKFAKQVIAADPKLRRASPNLLAKKILKLRSDWSKRTIRRALTPSK
jgi:hypothetical protein